MHWSYQWWGMHWVWWIVWVVLVIWIFFTPWDIPGQRSKKESAHDILQRRLASGEIGAEEY